MSPHGAKRRATDCHGGGCGSLSCDSCWARIMKRVSGSGDKLYWKLGQGTCDDSHERNEREDDLATASGSTQAEAVNDTNLDKSSARRKEQYRGLPGAARRASSPNPAPIDNKDGKEPSFQQMVDALDEKTVRSTLVRLASMAPSAQQVIRQAYTSHIRGIEMAKDQPPSPIDFDSYSKKAWHAMYTSDAAKRWVTLDEAGRASATQTALAIISGYVAYMRARINETTPYAIKLYAAETIRKILKSILLGSTGLAESVRRTLRTGENSIVHDTVLIIMCMSEEEMAAAMNTADEKGTLAQKYRWCRDEAKRLGLDSLSGLDTVIDMMGTS